MSIPALAALRQPKFMTAQANMKNPDIKFVILTLKNDKKMVVSSDSYHALFSIGDNMYKCLYCKIEMKENAKEDHKLSRSHLKVLEMYPPKEEYAEHLIRQLSPSTSLCIICNISIENIHLSRHILTEVHLEELQKALIRASNYSPR